MKIFKFYKKNCPPCYAFNRILNHIEIPENIEIINLDVEIEEYKNMAKSHGIKIVPSLLSENGNILNESKTEENILLFLKRESQYEISN